MATLKSTIAHQLREFISAGDARVKDSTIPDVFGLPPISALQDVFGRVTVGDMLPPLSALQVHYSRARDTIRDAITLLVNEGLVTPKQGIGTIIRDTSPVVMPYHSNAASQTWQDMMGPTATDIVISVEWEDADAETADWLRIDTGAPVLHRLRHRALTGAVLQTHHQWIVADVVDDIRIHVGVDLADETAPIATDLFMLMKQAGHPPRETTEQIRSRMPDAEERELMEIPPGVPATVIDRITPARGTGQPLEVSRIVGAGDRMVYSYTLPLAKRLGLEDEPPA